jgi:outer membrane receptor for ferrienterochelin and colicin
MGHGNSKLNPAFVNLGMKYKGLSFRAMGDFFSTTVRDSYDQVKSVPYKESFNGIYSELKYVWKVNDKFTLTPRVNFKEQTPWKTAYVDSTNGEYNKVARRVTGNLTASYNVNRYINIVAGGEYYSDFAVDKVDTFYNGKSTVNFFNYAFFAQGLIKTRFVNIILGARYDKHNVYGDAFVPRVGLTKKYNRFHFKALYSNSFRAPSIENINLSRATGIAPERTQVGELELGYQITHNSIFTVNFFDITTKHPIVYYYNDSAGVDTYVNGNASGTMGAEAEYRIKGQWGYIAVNYAYYTAQGKTNNPYFTSDQDTAISSSSLLAFANHRVNLNASFKIAKGLSINPSGSFYSKRYGVKSIDTLGTPVVSQFDPVFLFNLFIKYDTPIKGLTIGAGVYDLLDQKFKFIEPYSNGYHAPLPGPARELVFRLSYNLNFKNKN